MNTPSETEGVEKTMWMTKLKAVGAVLMAAITSAGLLAQQALLPKPKGESRPAVSAEMAQTEAKVAQIRELVSPRPGEHVANMAKIAWEHDPWEAAVKAAREGKPILAWGECGAGVPCGYG
jgi:hypothetical protein